MNNFVYISVATLILIGSLPVAAQNAHWFGTYVGSTIPQYEILGSHPVSRRQSGGPTEEIARNVFEMGESVCKSGGGVALVNVRIAMALGEVSSRSVKGFVETISPGKEIIVYGDCVYEISPITIVKSKKK